MVHVSNRSLSCDDCGKMFFILSKLEHHKRTVHEKLKPFHCEFCAFRCAAHGNLNLHRKTQHKAEKLSIKDYNNLHGIVVDKKIPCLVNPGNISAEVATKSKAQEGGNIDFDNNYQQSTLISNCVRFAKTDDNSVNIQSSHGHPTPGVIMSTSSYKCKNPQTKEIIRRQ